jgi:tetratricopeptide (TPR) repeat protein
VEKRKISNTNMLREGAICEKLGNIYTTLGHLNKALESFYKCLFLTQDETMKQHVLSCIAFVYGDMGDLKKTSESLDLISNMDNTDINYIINYNYIGGAYEKIGDYETARTYYNAQLKHDKCSARCNLGRIYCHLKLYKKAIDYSESALCMENISQEIECEAYKNIGLAYSNLREFDAAMHNFEKSLSIVEARRSDESQLYGEMAFIYFIKENFEKAIDFNIRAINIAFEIGQRNNECTLRGDLSDVYEYMGLFEEATKSRQKQLIIAKEMSYVSKQDFIQEKIDYNSKQFK